MMKICGNCTAQNSDGESSSERCGRPLAQYPPQQVSPPQSPYPQQVSGGLIGQALSRFLAIPVHKALLILAGLQGLQGIGYLALAAGGAFEMLIFTALSLYVAIGLWKGKRWAWNWAFGLSIGGLIGPLILSIIDGRLNINWLSIATMVFLFRPDILSQFGKGFRLAIPGKTKLPPTPPVPSDVQPQPQPQVNRVQPQPQVERSKYCRKCGIRLSADDVFCYACGTPVSHVTR